MTLAVFTGLIQHVATVQECHVHPGGARVSVDLGGWDHRPAPGDSISVNGCCLTVAAIRGTCVGFDCVNQTLERTTLGSLRIGCRVNLEHALTPTSFLGGHFVQGHVDGIGRVSAVESTPQHRRLRISSPGDILAYLIPRGSICVDGVSLTLAEVAPDQFTVALIPTTLERTTLAGLVVGDSVNLEADVLAKTVVTWLERMNLTQRKSAT